MHLKYLSKLNKKYFLQWDYAILNFLSRFYNSPSSPQQNYHPPVIPIPPPTYKCLTPPPADAFPPLTSQTGGRYMLCNLDNTELGCSKVLADFSFMQTGINVKIQVLCFCSFLEGPVLWLDISRGCSLYLVTF